MIVVRVRCTRKYASRALGDKEMPPVSKYQSRNVAVSSSNSRSMRRQDF
jgi:hypothetical protein